MTEIPAEGVLIPPGRWRMRLGVSPAGREEEDRGETHTREWRTIPKDQVPWGRHRFATSKADMRRAGRANLLERFSSPVTTPGSHAQASWVRSLRPPGMPSASSPALQSPVLPRPAHSSPSVQVPVTCRAAAARLLLGVAWASVGSCG